MSDPGNQPDGDAIDAGAARPVATTFLAECFWPGVTAAKLAHAATRAAGHAEAACIELILIPDDEIVLGLFEATSAAAVTRAGRCAGLPVERVLASLHVRPPGLDPSAALERDRDPHAIPTAEDLPAAGGLSPRRMIAAAATVFRRSIATKRPGRALVIASLATSAFMLSATSALATFPGKNGRIAFHSATAAGTQIFTMGPDGRELRQVTHVSGDAIDADWSPDGRQIAFEFDGADGSAQVAITNADGSGKPVTVPGIGVFNGDPSFTPDGRRLVYGFSDGEHGGIESMNLDGSDQRRILTDDFVEDPNVSPDGRTLSVTCQKDPHVLQALCTFPPTGGDPNITPFTAEVGAKSDWAPDGHQLVFTDHSDRPNPGDSANVGVVAPDGSDEHLLTHFSGGDTNAFAGSYSPDGRWIVFRLETGGRFGLFRMRPDGTHLRTILPLSDLAPRFIDWGPRTDDDAGLGEDQGH